MTLERKKTFSKKNVSWLSRKTTTERFTMSNSNNNQLNIPQAREAGDLGESDGQKRTTRTNKIVHP
jgi:hypothetical protein